jgi:hypothetical protein
VRLWHLNVCIHSQLVHPINFKTTNTAESDKKTPANRCSQLRASRRQFVHFTCHSGNTVPQFEHDQIIFGMGTSFRSDGRDATSDEKRENNRRGMILKPGSARRFWL